MSFRRNTIEELKENGDLEPQILRQSVPNMTVCITGITGYLGSWILHQFLSDGTYKVRGTYRPNSLNKLAELRNRYDDFDEEDELFERFHDESFFECVEMELTDPTSVNEAIRGCSYVVHSASPYPTRNPRNDKDVIDPAVEGTKNVLAACAQNGVEKVVMTSSLHSIIDYNSEETKFFESNETPEITNRMCTYTKSKIMAENEARKYMNGLREDQKFKLIILNPGFMLGPLFYNHTCTSEDIFTKILLGRYPGLPDVYLNTVDVRDVAEAHFKAISEDLKNEKYILVENTYEYVNIGQLIYDNFVDKCKQELDPTRTKLMFCTAKMASYFIPEAAQIMDAWHKKKKAISEHKDELNIEYKDLVESVIEMTESLINLKAIPLTI